GRTRPATQRGSARSWAVAVGTAPREAPPTVVGSLGACASRGGFPTLGRGSEDSDTCHRTPESRAEAHCERISSLRRRPLFRVLSNALSSGSGAHAPPCWLLWLPNRPSRVRDVRAISGGEWFPLRY